MISHTFRASYKIAPKKLAYGNICWYNQQR
jgi:hypothetical protein